MVRNAAIKNRPQISKYLFIFLLEIWEFLLLLELLKQLRKWSFN